MRNHEKPRIAPYLLAAALLSTALAAGSSRAATTAASSTSVFNFSESAQRQNASQATENHTGNAPVPEPSTWVSLAGLLGVCAGLAVSGRSKRPRG
jgi:spermidine/putrescine-binding protein